jgi:hypothetical protein
LPSVVVTLHVVDMHKVSRFRHRHELPIRGEADGSDGSKVTPKNMDSFREVPRVPDSACLVLVASGKRSAIRAPS